MHFCFTIPYGLLLVLGASSVRQERQHCVTGWGSRHRVAACPRRLSQPPSFP
ncbi:UNVERIFIED_CONTAM: hypothetical protein Slati_2061300 [Sesamum latifolium]|uniref:Uncharacterized protein n=1 Tax=Sesamum latifolium TaxID=2727402 RepID=A0AAW2WRK3_9LAMI